MNKILPIIIFLLYSSNSYSQSHLTFVDTLALNINLVHLENCSLQTERKLPNRKNHKSYNFLLDNYSVSTTEITIRQFIIFLNNSNVDSNGYINDKHVIDTKYYNSPVEFNSKTRKFYFKSSEKASNDECPITVVSQYGAIEFCLWLTKLTNKYFRLPTEAEWEFAAKGNSNSLYSGSNCLDSVGWYNSNSKSILHIVGQKSPNAFGLYDMSGNAAEWCLDTDRAKIKGDSIINPICINGWNTITKGGSSYDSINRCTVKSTSNRYFYSRSSSVGFRVVCTDTLRTNFQCFEAPRNRKNYQMINGKTMRKSINPEMQIDFGRASSINVGISRNWAIYNGRFLPEYQHGVFINIGLGIFDNNSFISQIGYQFYYMTLINSKISIVNYTNSQKTQSYLRPEIGISFLSLITFSYGYNISLQKNDTFGFNGNIFTLKFSMPIWDKEKTINNNQYCNSM